MTDAFALSDDEIRRDVIAGLSRPQKTLPGKFLWDETGSNIFDRICQTNGYYLTRREIELLEQAAPRIATALGPGAILIEYGSGASHKVRLLLDALPAPAAYVAIDISAAYLQSACARIAFDYPDVTVQPVVADYTLPIALPSDIPDGPRLGFFPGSTIGNFDAEGVVAFLSRARTTIGRGRLLIGHDPNRDPERLHQAYADADGLMPALHLNMLHHLNRTIDAGFEVDAFRHAIHLASDPPRTEARLVATRPTACTIDGRTFTFTLGEHIHTDTSFKMDADTFLRLATAAGWRGEALWRDPDDLYALHLLATR